ncbi:MAG: hypothetical protein R3275_09470, partial [Saprospiraceae bacterium]|nr:hypothetical protein [Saprospiraceae bacterium]
MKKFCLLLSSIFLSLNVAMAQLPHGASAPNITVNDIYGNSYSLFSHTSAGKGGVLYFFATWCGPCWSYHNSGTLTQVYNNLGSISAIIALEADSRTNTGCITNNGCNYSTQGNWATVPYQIANLTATNGPNVASQYQINYYPTLYVISHDNRAYELRNKSYSIVRSWLQESFFLDVNPVIGHAYCGGDGYITLNRTKGYGAITYNWSNGATTEDLQDLDAGSYTVTVEDQNGYDKVFGPYVINGPSQALTLTTIAEIDVSCHGGNDGEVKVNASGGNGGYQFNWSNGDFGSTTSDLSAGIYWVTLTDSKGCQEIESYVITEPAALSADLEKTNEQCEKANGQIYVTPKGGTSPYLYDIGDGPTSDPLFKDLEAGEYDVEVIDDQNCKWTESVELEHEMGPEALAGDDRSINCEFPSIELEGGGSNGENMSYNWSTIDGNIIGDPDQRDIEIDSAGTYIFEVVDNDLDCQDRDTIEVTNGRSYPIVEFDPTDTINCKQTTVWVSVQKRDSTDVKWWTTEGRILSEVDSHAIEVDHATWYFTSLKDTFSHCVTNDSI